jgi:nucleoside-diphosphate-sugar epimerase
VNGSTTREENLPTLQKRGINSFVISIDDKNITGKVDLFLKSEILIVNIPPKRRPDIIEYYPSQMKLLIKQIELSSVKKVLFVSSTSVNQNTNGIVNEQTDPKPEKDSGKALIITENMFLDNSNFVTTVLRFAGLMGPDRNPGRFLAGKENLGGAETPVNLIHLDDCIGIIESIIEKEAWGEILNGCHPDHPSRKEYYTSAAKKLNLPLPHFNASIPQDFKIVSGQKVEEMLNYTYRSKIS